MNVKLQAATLIEQIDAARANVAYLMRAQGIPQRLLNQLDDCDSCLEAARMSAREFQLDNRLTIAPEKVS